jgi:serine/threonine protein kinase
VKRVGPYEVVAELGRGGMGVVYEVRGPDDPRRLALKLILPGVADAQALARFGREAELLARVQHGGIVRVVTLARAPEGPYLVTELVEGEELGDRLTRGPLTPDEAARIVRGVADALEAVHRAGVVHRDLKPSNVMLRPNGSPVLLDFGIAQDESAEKLTQTGALLGTPNYMAPEQAGGERELIGPRTDVYSLGAVLYTCLSGEKPFGEKSSLALVKAVLTSTPEPLSKLRPDVPKGLAAICRRAMAPDLGDRYPGAAALRNDLDLFLAGERPRAIDSAPSPGRRRTLALGGALLLLLVAAAAAAGLASGEDTLDSDGVDTPKAAPLDPQAERRAQGLEEYVQLGVRLDLSEARRWNERFGSVPALAATREKLRVRYLQRSFHQDEPEPVERPHADWTARFTRIGDSLWSYSYSDSRESSLIRWDPGSRSRSLEGSSPPSVRALVLQSDRQRGWVASQQDSRLYRLEVGEALTTTETTVPVRGVDPDVADSRPTPLLCMALSPEEDLLALGYIDGGLRLVRTGDLEVVRDWKPHADAVRAVAFLPGGGMVSASGSQHDAEDVGDMERGVHRLTLWSPTWDVVAEKALNFPPHCLAVSPDGALVAVGITASREILLYASTDGALVEQLVGEGAAVVGNARNLNMPSDHDPVAAINGTPEDLVFSPDGERLYALSEKDSLNGESEIRVWSLEDPAETEELAILAKDLFLLDIALTPDGAELWVHAADAQRRPRLQVYCVDLPQAK